MLDTHALPSLTALKAFLVVAEQGSVSVAAQRLNVTHGAVSRQVKQLEEQLGVTLISKDGRGIKLTDLGQQLYAEIAPAMSSIAESCQQVRRAQNNKPIVLACPGSILARWLIPRLNQLQQDLPELSLQLITSSDDENPLQQGADASLYFSSQAQPAITPTFVLDQERIGPVVSPEFARQHRLLESSVSRIQDFAVLYTESRPQAWPDWLAQQLPHSQLQMAQGFPHLYYLLEATAAGMGIGIAPEQLVHESLLQGRLIAPWGFVSTQAQLQLSVLNPALSADIEKLAHWFTTHL